MASSNVLFRLIGKDDASAEFLKVAAAAEATKSAMDNLSGASLGLLKANGLASLVPMLAGASAAAAELGTSLAAGAGAGGIFGLSVLGMVKDMVKQQTAIASTQKALDGATKGTSTYRTELQKLHAEQTAFNQTFGPAAAGFEKMKAAFTSFEDKTGTVTKGVLAKGFNLVASVLPKLVPVSNAAGKAVGHLLDQLTAWTKSPEFASVLKWLKTSGPIAIKAFGDSIGHIIHGLGEIFANFVGPGNKAAHTLEGLTAAFDKWAGTKGVSDSVQGFLKYVSSNGHNITASLQALATAAPKIAVALGGLGSANLSVTTHALTLIAGLPQGAFNAVANGLFAIYVASKALMFVQALWAVIKLGAVAMETLRGACIGTRIGLAALFVQEKLMAPAMETLRGACIGTRIALAALFVQEKLMAVATKAYAAAQWLLNAAMDANPIGIVIVALAALAVGLIYAYKHSETFRNIVNGAFHDVAAVAGAAVGFIKAHWAPIFAILGGPVGLAAVLIIKNFSKIEDAIKAAGAVARWLWNNAFQPALSLIVHATADVISMWAHLLSALSHVPGFGWVKSAANALQSAADKANALADNINKIPTHKTSTVDIYVNTIKNLMVHRQHVVAQADGGQTTKPGWSLIGERGPELMYMPKSATVVPLNRAREFAGSGVTVNVYASNLVDPQQTARAIQTELVKLKRQRGGASLGLS